MGRPKKVVEAVEDVEEVAVEETTGEPEPLADLSVLVDLAKREHAKFAVFGGGKVNDAGRKLAIDGKAKGLKDDALVVFVYEGLGGLVDRAKAEKNRLVEKAEALRKRNR